MPLAAPLPATLVQLCRHRTHPHAAGETFLASDGEDLSTPELMRHLARGLNKPARLFPFPPGLLYSGAKLLGREAMIDRLCGSLKVDCGKARQVLGWTPPVSVDEGLERTAPGYRLGSGGGWGRVYPLSFCHSTWSRPC